MLKGAKNANLYKLLMTHSDSSSEVDPPCCLHEELNDGAAGIETHFSSNKRSFWSLEADG